MPRKKRLAKRKKKLEPGQTGNPYAVDQGGYLASLSEPRRSACTQCNGHGVIPSEAVDSPPHTCPACEGSGKGAILM